MKNIDPLNPDVKPEDPPVSQQVSQQPPQEPQNTSSEPAEPTQDNPAPFQPYINIGASGPPSKPEEVVDTPSPTFAPKPEESSPSISSNIYPTPLSPEERQAKREQLEEEVKVANGFAISQIAIPGIVGLYSLYVLFEILKSLFKSSEYSSMSGFGEPGGIFVLAGWLYILFGLVLLASALILSYKIFRASLISLALLTGPVAIYLGFSLITYIMSLSSEYGDFIGGPSILQLIAELVLAVSLILAWTKDKKSYL